MKGEAIEYVQQQLKIAEGEVMQRDLEIQKLNQKILEIGFNFNVRAVNVRAKEHTPFSG